MGIHGDLENVEYPSCVHCGDNTTAWDRHMNSIHRTHCVGCNRPWDPRCHTVTVIVKDGTVRFEADGKPQGKPVTLPQGVEIAMAVGAAEGPFEASGATFDLDLQGQYTDNNGKTIDV